MLVQMERQIDREIAADQKKLGVNDGLENQNGLDDDSDSDIEDEETVLMYGPVPQIVTNDLKSLDEMVCEVFICDVYQFKIYDTSFYFIHTLARLISWRINNFDDFTSGTNNTYLSIVNSDLTQI